MNVIARTLLIILAGWILLNITGFLGCDCGSPCEEEGDCQTTTSTTTTYTTITYTTITYTTDTSSSTTMSSEDCMDEYEIDLNQSWTLIELNGSTSVPTQTMNITNCSFLVDNDNECSGECDFTLENDDYTFSGSVILYTPSTPIPIDFVLEQALDYADQDITNDMIDAKNGATSKAIWKQEGNTLSIKEPSNDHSIDRPGDFETEAGYEIAKYSK